jgi:hypothetical protein
MDDMDTVIDQSEESNKQINNDHLKEVSLGGDDAANPNLNPDLLP